MSNHPPAAAKRLTVPRTYVSLLGFAWVLGATAHAQSAPLLEGVRLHRPGIVEQAANELRVCQAARCAELGRLTLLLGYLQLSEGDPHSARLTLRSVPPPAALEPYHAYYLAQAEFYANNPGAAAELLVRASKSAPPSLSVRLSARAGEALIAAGRPTEAAPYLELSTRQMGRPELYWARAVARGATGDAKGRLDDLRRLAVSFPSHPYASDALALIAREDPKPLTFDERLTRAALLLDDSAQAALDELAILHKQKLAQTRVHRARAALIAARAHYALGDPTRGDPQVKLATQGPPEVAAEATYAKARYLLRTNDNAAARKVMIEVDKKWPGTSSAKEAGFYVGWLAFQAENLERAVESFAAYEKKYPRGRRRDDAMWFRALAQLLLGQHEPARQTLEELTRQFPGSSLVPQALYWAARARQLGDPKADVSGEYERLIETFPASFYSLLSSERLRALGRTPPIAFPQPPRERKVKPPAALDLAVQLLQAGLHADATMEISAQTSRVRGTEAALEFGHALYGLGEFGAAYGIATRSLWGKAFTDKDGEALALMYPRPFAPVVSPESKASSVDPNLTWSIMRRESTFRPELMSAANARGLMQIIPPTASAIAQQREETAPDADGLFAPELNVRYGAWYLGKLLERFKHPALVAAAYNAGPPVTERWAKEYGDQPLDLFVELVSYRETRAYIKQVIADFHVYRALYETNGVLPSISLDVPTPSDEGVRF